MSHIPVLLHEVIEVLNVRPGNFVIDGTLGSAGHAKELIKRILPNGIFLGVDRDSSAIANFKVRAPGLPGRQAGVRVITSQGNYSQLPTMLSELNLPQADALLLDLGFSSTQLVGKGMSFHYDEPLTMTYEEGATPVKELLKQMSETELTRILREFGEERFAPAIAKSISQRAKSGKMETTKDLVEAVIGAVPKNYERGRIHPATRTFQALRIYANAELLHLKSLLQNLYNIVRPGGRVAIISFHSLEDRIVKNYFKDYARHGGGSSVEAVKSGQAGELPNASSAPRGAELLTKKPIIASEAELRVNPRARSAKLRALLL